MSTTNAYLWKAWIDHTASGFSGLTVTVPAAHGVLILAAMTVLVGFAGDAAWTITAYALHQYRATNEPQTGLFRMQQVSLRNSGSAIGTVLELVCMGHAWSGKTSEAKRRAYGLAIWPLCIKIGFIVAAVFVGRTTVAAYKANVILLEPTVCGLEGEAHSMNNLHDIFDIQAKHANDTRQSRAYAYDCYEAATGALGCTSLKVQKLPFNVNPNATCPFGDLCVLGQDTAFQVVSEPLNSLTHLGINSAAQDQVTAQVATTCSIISLKNFTEQISDPHSNGQWFLTNVYLGPLPGSDVNYTWTYAELQSQQKVLYTTS